MGKENALTIGLRPSIDNWSPVARRSANNPDTGDAVIAFEQRCQIAISIAGNEEDVRRAMNKAQAYIYPGETTLGRACVYSDLSPYRQIKVLDVITDAVIRVEIEDRQTFESLGIDIDALCTEWFEANRGKPTRRTLPEILRDISALPAEYMKRVLSWRPKSKIGE